MLLVVLFGIYSVVALVYGVVTFRTVPEEAAALRQVEYGQGLMSLHLSL